jgi:hypothetical protein
MGLCQAVSMQAGKLVCLTLLVPFDGMGLCTAARLSLSAVRSEGLPLCTSRRQMRFGGNPPTHESVTKRARLYKLCRDSLEALRSLGEARQFG